MSASPEGPSERLELIRVEYEGWGRTDFSNPAGLLDGGLNISFDELGQATIEMTADSSTLRSKRKLNFGLEKFSTQWRGLPTL